MDICKVREDINKEKIIWTSYKKYLQKTIKQSLELKKYWSKKMINYALSEKVIIIRLITGLIKKT